MTGFEATPDCRGLSAYVSLRLAAAQPSSFFNRGVASTSAIQAFTLITTSQVISLRLLLPLPKLRSPG